MTEIDPTAENPKRLDKTTDLVAIVADAGLAALTPETMRHIPAIGMLVGLWKASDEVRNNLYLRKVKRFLDAFDSTTYEQRLEFTEALESEGKTEEFGETILLILEKIDDTIKPKLIGKVLAAHIQGDIEYDKAMRLAAIINNCYGQDIEYIRNFREGTQGTNKPVADALFAAGLLSNNGIDGGNFTDPNSGGVIYGLNEYGMLLAKYGWD